MKHDLEVKIFYSDRYFYMSQDISHNVLLLLTSLMEQTILLRYIAYIPHFEVQYSKILSGGVDFITVNVVIFAGGKFRENAVKTFHVGVIFTILLIFP